MAEEVDIERFDSWADIPEGEGGAWTTDADGKLIRYRDSERARYRYLEQLPALLLGVRHHPGSAASASDLPLARLTSVAGLEWQLVAHQSAGHACNQHYFAALILEPRSVAVLRAMEEVERRYLDSQLGWYGGPSLDQAQEYRALVQGLFAIDCNLSYSHFEEALYPLDLDPYDSRGTLQMLTEIELPEPLSELVLSEADEHPLLRPQPQFELYVLGENSD